MSKVIGVLSGKGGVGKTTLVANLGASLVGEEYIPKGFWYNFKRFIISKDSSDYLSINLIFS